MVNVLRYTADAYLANLQLVLLFSLSAVIAFIVPVFASFPTYNDAGSIFLRTASIFINLTPVSITVIIASTILSTLFLSFAIVAINVMVKHSRTHTRIRREVMAGLESYTGKVFLVLLAFNAILIITNMVAYRYQIGNYITWVVALALTPFFFYSPASIVIDDNKMVRSLKASLKFFRKRPEYFGLWIGCAVVSYTVLDLAAISIAGPLVAEYIVLVVGSLLILPFLIMLQGESYMKRFSMLRH